MKKGTTGSATIHIDAPPEKVYAVVTDVSRMGEWSPETNAAEWLDGATGPAVGVRFKGKNKNGFARWSTKPRVVAADDGREFAFVVGFAGRDLTKWTYRFEPDASGSKVTESFEMVNDMPSYIAAFEKYVMRVKDRRTELIADIEKTLARIKSAVEGSAG
jgi:uncharacterized protein YndB with AHSA1/START domain